jgi:tetratricopeptide (TPR) repeat protein
MKFILFSDSDERRGKILSIFAEAGREIISIKDTDLLVGAVEKSNFPVVLVDVKFSHFPAFRISKELKEKFSEKNMKVFLIMPQFENKQKILDLWLADGLIFYNELEEDIRKLLQQFPQVKIGNFREKPFLALLLELKSKAFSGTLTVNKDNDEKAVYFEKGIPKYAITSRREEKIGEFLLRHGKISSAELERFLDAAKNSGKRLGEYLIEKEIIEREEFKKVLQNQMEEIVESIFGWDDANWTLSSENIAVLEDVLIERGLEELIYYGVMRYAEVSSKVKNTDVPKLLVAPEEIFEKYPLKQIERELIEMFQGNETIESLSFKSECTLKEIQRLCYLLSETGAVELLSVPAENVPKAVIGKIEPMELKIEPSISEESPEIPAEVSSEEVMLQERPEMELQAREEKDAGETRYFQPLLRRFQLNSILLISLVLVISLSTGLIIVKKRAENRLLNEKIMHSSELIKSDSLPALKRAAQILSDCAKKDVNNQIISLLAFAEFRLFELTNDRKYFDEAKNAVQLSTGKGNGNNELKPLMLLLSIGEGDMANANKVLNEIPASNTPISLYAQARYMLESTGDAERATGILSAATSEDMQAIKLQLANAWSMSGNLNKLHETLKDLQKEIPGHPDVIMLKGDEKFLEGNYNEAETLYRLSLDYRPGHIQTTIRLARAHLAMNQSERVIGELEPVITTTDIKTNCGKTARLLYAQALQKLKNLEKAKELLLQLASVYPSDDSIRNYLESVEKSIKNESAKKAKEETIADLLRRAKNLYNKGKYEKALKVFERGIDRADDEFLYWYALTLEETGNTTAGFLQLKKAEGINPENALVHKELGKLYKERGNEEESQRHFKLYLQYLKK